jgi:hypothetical protein
MPGFGAASSAIRCGVPRTPMLVQCFYPPSAQTSAVLAGTRMNGVTQSGCSTGCLPGETALSNTRNNQPNELPRIPKPRLAGQRCASSGNGEFRASGQSASSWFAAEGIAPNHAYGAMGALLPWSEALPAHVRNRNNDMLTSPTACVCGGAYLSKWLTN